MGRRRPARLCSGPRQVDVPDLSVGFPNPEVDIKLIDEREDHSSSSGYLDRCTTHNRWTYRWPDNARGHIAKYTDCTYFVTPNSERGLIHPDIQLENTLTGSADEYWDYCDTDGRMTSEQYRYKIGWEVP